MRAFIILLIVLVTVCAAPHLLAQDTVPQTQVMTAEKMVAILTAVADESQATPSRVLMKYRGIDLQCIYDETHDRMCIISPVARQGDITPVQFAKAMETNFHTALDARYALNNGVLYSAFIHPLSPLTESQIQSALVQTATLAVTFGKEYTSGSLTFMGGKKPL